MIYKWWRVKEKWNIKRGKERKIGNKSDGNREKCRLKERREKKRDERRTSYTGRVGCEGKQTARILKFGLYYSSVCIGQINSRWSGGAVASFPLVLVWTLANSLRFSCNCSGSCLNEISDKTISPACEGDTKKIIVYKCQSCVKMNTAYSSSLSRYSFWESDFLTMLFAFGSR